MRSQGGSKHGGVPWFSSREGSSRAGWRKPVGCVELAMTHRSASRCYLLSGVREASLAPNLPLATILPLHAAGRKLGSSCSIPPFSF